MSEHAVYDANILAAIRGPLHENLIGVSDFVQETQEIILRVADANLSVLLTGETGTGKDVVARLLHRRSTRNGHPFVKVNCPALPHELLESELFGYEKGAFTGARTPKPGRFELADKGTIFLDEIAEIAESVQVKLMQVLDGEKFMRIGGMRMVQSSARIIAATNVNIEAAVRDGRLRGDIAYRLNEFVIHMIPLRERPEDIPALVEHFTYNYSKRLDREYVAPSPASLQAMQGQRWRGNVRELAARVKEYVATGEESALVDDGSNGSRSGRGVGERAASPTDGNGGNGRAEKRFVSLKEAARKAVETTERALIEEALRHTLWNRREAAKLLRISYSSLLRRIDTYEIGKS